MEKTVQFLHLCVLFTMYVQGSEHAAKDYVSQFAPGSFRKNIFQRKKPNHPPFACPDMKPSDTTPTSAHTLKPADIKIVAALGDSMTAALSAGATNFSQLETEYRCISWSIGGCETLSTVVTLPNILKLFNPNIIGSSMENTVYKKPSTLKQTAFNFAMSGATSGLLPKQTRSLIDTLKSFPGIDFVQDWKLVTVFAGSNDLCKNCMDASTNRFIHNVSTALDILLDEMPRTIVNLVQLLPIHNFQPVNNGSPLCKLQGLMCPCLNNSGGNSDQLKGLRKVNREFQEKLAELVKSGRYDHREDFAVILQPFLKDVEPPLNADGGIDFSTFSPDCFHLSIKGHKAMATALWNNMFQPEGHKVGLNSVFKSPQLICPSKDHPYIYTRRTSVSALHQIEEGFLFNPRLGGVREVVKDRSHGRVVQRST